jgi:hypothetical protein
MAGITFGGESFRSSTEAVGIKLGTWDTDRLREDGGSEEDADAGTQDGIGMVSVGEV